MTPSRLPKFIKDWLTDKDVDPEDLNENELYTVACYLFENYDFESGFEKDRHTKQAIKRFVDRESEDHINLPDFIDSIFY